MTDAHLKHAFWDGKWQSGSGGTFVVENPATRSKIADVTDCTKEDVNIAIACAAEAFVSWSQTSVIERANLLMKLRDAILQQKDTIATLVTMENGKPKSEALGEVGMGATFFEWYAGETRRQYGEMIPSGAKSKRMITMRQPLGVAALITPWNFPFAMLARKLSAALAAGCTSVIKPSEDTPLSSIYFGKLCQDVGVPAGVINVVPCSRNRVKEVGSALCESPDVKVVSFTGSSPVGQNIYSQCGPSMKRLSLELGGNAPFIVFPSANIDMAVSGFMIAKFRNNGQSCIGANRIYVHETLHDEFVSKVLAKMQTDLKQGSGLDEDVNMGPMINQRQRDRLLKLFNNAIDSGANLHTGGKASKGLFFAPTLLTNVRHDMEIAREEIFGPLAAIIKFKTEEEVLTMANDTEMGLAAYVFSSDIQQCWRTSEALQFGMVGVNESLFSTCEAPFGGIKASGFGKEGSRHGLDDYTNLKYVCLGNMA